MELTFTYKPELKLYIAEFRADKEFNIHIERPEPGYISMQQNSAEGGKYAAVDDWGTQNNDKLIIDYESGYFVTPKFIKIISKVLPTYAAITTDGEITEIKSQAKVVEISSNGTTSVEPDAGFSYLSKVDVKVDVPTSGEGGGESGSETSTKFALEPNGWCWKLSDELIADTTALYQALNEFFVLSGRIYDSVMKLSYGAVTTTSSSDDRLTYRHIGDLGNSNTIARIVAIREAYGAELTIGESSYKGDSLYDIVSKMRGLSEAEFLSMMSESGFTRITNEEYEELMNA